MRSRNYFVPGVAANLLLMATLLLTAQAIIREKEIGTMEQLMVTPMRPIELMLEKLSRSLWQEWISILWPQMLILTIYGAAILGLSALRFDKSLD